jgi:CHAT domain-containing protein/tetratricopeptide (TPR) repeat protein
MIQKIEIPTTPSETGPETRFLHAVSDYIRGGTRAITVFLNILFLGAALSAQNQPPRELTVAPVSGQILGNETNRYKVVLAENDFLQVRAEQPGADVELALINPSGAYVARMENALRKGSTEVLVFTAKQPGTYVIEVKCASEKAEKGGYSIRREPLRAATSKDKRREEIQRQYFEGILIRKSGKFADAMAALSKVLPQWREVGDDLMAKATEKLITQLDARVNFFKGRELAIKDNASREEIRTVIELSLKASRLFREGGEPSLEAQTLMAAAAAMETQAAKDNDPAQKRAARDVWITVLDLFHKLPDPNLELYSLVRINSLSAEVGDREALLKYLLITLPFYEKDPKLKQNEADVSNDIAAVYIELGEYTEALPYALRSLPPRKEGPDKCRYATTLTTIGTIYSGMEKKALAIDFLKNRTLPLYTEKGQCAAENTVTLTNLGLVYDDLGEHRTALQYYKKALDLNVGKIGTIAAIYNNMGRANYSLGRNQTLSDNIVEANALYEEARGNFEKSAALYRAPELADKRTESTVLANIGVTLLAMGKLNEALKVLTDQALPIKRTERDKVGEAQVLNHIGEAYLTMKENDKALDYLIRALPLIREASERNEEAITLGNIMAVLERSGSRGPAIFYGKQAVNIFQDIRNVASVKESGIQRSFFRTVKDSYRKLAELLLMEGRWEEAVQVLNLCQTPDFTDLDLSETPKDRFLSLSGSEQKYARQYEAAGKKLGDIGAKKAGDPGFEKRERDMETASKDFLLLQKDIKKNLPGSPAAADRAPAKSASDMQGYLDLLNTKEKRKHVTIYSLVGSDCLYFVLITAGNNNGARAGAKNVKASIKLFTSPVGKFELNDRIANFLRVLDRGNDVLRDPYKYGEELYRLIFGSRLQTNPGVNLEADLAAYSPAVIHWSLDENLRYIPIAALSDDKRQYVVEKYETVVFTNSKKETFMKDPRLWTSCTGFGTSGSFGDFKALPGIKKEAASICTPASNIIKGHFFLDNAFRRKKIEAFANETKPPVIHFSTHFRFLPGDAQSSFFLLGDGEQFSLYEMENFPGLFKNVDLLTAAACSTAVFKANNDGKEINTFAELAQKLGANSVIATLWNVDDGGTSRLILEFYRLYSERLKVPGAKLPSKSELLRLAQLELLKGARKDDLDCGQAGRGAPRGSDLGTGDSPLPQFPYNPERPCAHPSFWSPFVLYGNSR